MSKIKTIYKYVQLFRWYYFQNLVDLTYFKCFLIQNNMTWPILD